MPKTSMAMIASLERMNSVLLDLRALWRDAVADPLADQPELEIRGGGPLGLEAGDHGAELRVVEVVVVMGHLLAIRTAHADS